MHFWYLGKLEREEKCQVLLFPERNHPFKLVFAPNIDQSVLCYRIVMFVVMLVMLCLVMLVMLVSYVSYVSYVS